MLKAIDKALAGAIDVVADDVQATVKSVREQGMMRTLGDAVEDAATLVAGGATSAWVGLGGKRGPEKGISQHSGVSSSYADLCAAPGSKGMGGGGGAVFPYSPQLTNGSGGGKTSVPKFGGAGSFSSGIGIQRAFAPTTPGGIQVFAKAPMPSPPPYAGPGTGQLRAYNGGPAPSTSAPSSYAYSGTTSAVPGVKDPLIETAVLAMRFSGIKAEDSANQRCFDCGSTDTEWASVSFGVFLCIECGGHHRQMGTHISRIRSCKLDSWTDRQIRIFDFGSNRRLGDFFAANHVPSSARYQRYVTPAAEWYRESWIKSCTLGKPVPPPPPGIVAGPCEVQVAAPQAPKAAAPAATADLMDFGEQPKAQPQTRAQPQADLLGFGDAPASTPASTPSSADLLGFGDMPVPSSTPASADLLNFGFSPSPSTSAPVTGLDFLGVSAPASGPKGNLGFGATAAPAPAPAAKAPAAPVLKGGLDDLLSFANLSEPARPPGQAMWGGR